MAITYKATVRVISIESEPKNIHLFIFLAHLKWLVPADNLMLKTETMCTIKIFRRGGGVVDGEGDSSEGCLKWVVGVINPISTGRCFPLPAQ